MVVADRVNRADSWHRIAKYIFALAYMGNLRRQFAFVISFRLRKQIWSLLTYTHTPYVSASQLSQNRLSMTTWCCFPFLRSIESTLGNSLLRTPPTAVLLCWIVVYAVRRRRRQIDLRDEEAMNLSSNVQVKYRSEKKEKMQTVAEVLILGTKIYLWKIDRPRAWHTRNTNKINSWSSVIVTDSLVSYTPAVRLKHSLDLCELC